MDSVLTLYGRFYAGDVSRLDAFNVWDVKVVC